jgi:hypothetical protein
MPAETLWAFLQCVSGVLQGHCAAGVALLFVGLCITVAALLVLWMIGQFVSGL